MRRGDEPPPAGDPVDLSARCRDAGGALRIKDLRDARCPDYAPLPNRFPGREVVLEEAVVTGVWGSDFTVQDPDGGPYSALFVYGPRPRLPVAVAPGDVVRLTGTVIEFYTLTELGPAGVGGGIEVLRRGGAVPAPVAVGDPARIADGGDLVEALESRLVLLTDVLVTDTAPDCPLDFRMFVVSGGLRVQNDDPPVFQYAAARFDVISRLVGVVHFSFDHNKLLPRGDGDIEAIRCGGTPDKCEAADCPVAPDAVESGRLVITEIQDNPEGDDSLREYVELFNPGPAAVDLDGWAVRDCADRGVALRGRVAPGGYHVIAASTDPAANGGVPAQADMGDLFLPNGFGSVLVYDPQGGLADQVRYEVGGAWPVRRGGQSLELVDPASDNRDGAAWARASEDYGEGGQGSPGAAYRR